MPFQKVPHELLSDLQNYRETFWLNPFYQRSSDVLPGLPLGLSDVMETRKRLERFQPFIAQAFPETDSVQGRIESPLSPIPRIRDHLRNTYQHHLPGKLFLKEDNRLPVSGSIKARGGIYEVLKHAETVLIHANLLRLEDDYRLLATPEKINVLGQHTIAVGSTGNLGLSVGIMARALGFQVVVHMSKDARRWKKDLLRKHGAVVIEHPGDYGQAVLQGRQQAAEDPFCHFIDDEHSLDLLLGYSTAAVAISEQLTQHGITVDAAHPLFVYLPCGVGGGPGGITFGLKQIYKDDVHCFFAEPTHSPAMLLGLASGLHEMISVEDIGLDNQTAADGLAVARPSGLIGRMLAPVIAGAFTVCDDRLYRDLALMADLEGKALEPSALAGLSGMPRLLNQTSFWQNQPADARQENATHIVWGTGGAMVPMEEMASYRAIGRRLINTI